MQTNLRIDLKLYCHEDIVPPNPDQFSKVIQEIDQELGGVAETQKNIAIALDSRNVANDEIAAQYLIWLQEVSDLGVKIQGCRSRIKQQMAYLPFVDHKTCTFGLEALSELEQRSYRLEEKGKRLALLVDSPEHRDTFKLTKEIVRKCVKANTLTSSTLDELAKKVEDLITRQRESLTNADLYVRKSIRAFHTDAIHFLTYVTNCTFSDDREIQERINTLPALLNEEEIACTVPRIAQELTQAEDLYFQSFKNTVLPNERYFKNGIYQAGRRYPKIATRIEEMHKIAKGLYQIETDLEKSIKRAWQGTPVGCPHSYQACLQVLGDNLARQKQSLYSVELCNQVHDGLYYAASLSIWIDEIQRLLDFHTKVTGSVWQQVGQLQQLFCKYLQPFCTMAFSSQIMLEKPIYDLYDIIKKLHIASCTSEQISFFKEYKERIMTIVNKTLARTEKTIFIHYPNEDIAEENVLARSTQVDSYFLKSLIAKKVVKCLHFTDERFDLSLDLILATIVAHEPYVSSVNRTVSQGEHLKELIDVYKSAAGFEEDKQALVQFCDILALLKQCGESSATRFIVCEILQRLSEVHKTVVNRERWDAFFKLVEEKVTTFTKLYSYPDWSLNGEKTLFKLLLEAHWASNEQKQLQAQEVAAQLQIADVDSSIVTLLEALALKMFLVSHGRTLSPLEKSYLPSLFFKFLQNPASWYAQYGIGTMEAALYMFLQSTIMQIDPLLVLNDSLNTKRSEEPFLQTWETTIKQYLEVKSAVASNKFPNKTFLAQMYQSYLTDLSEVCRKLKKRGNDYAHYIFNGILEELNKALA